MLRSQATMFPLPKPVLKKTSVDPEIPQFEGEDLGNKDENGRGSFGAVYRTSLGEKELVVKKLFCAGDEDSQKEFLKEAKLMISLKHDNVVQLKAICLQPSAILSEFVYFDFQCFSDETRVYNLAEFLRHVNRNYNCEGFTRVMPHIAESVARGLQYLHSKDIVHRDVKPGNILVSNQHYCSITEVRLDTRKLTFRKCNVVGHTFVRWSWSSLQSFHGYQETRLNLLKMLYLPLSVLTFVLLC